MKIIFDATNCGLGDTGGTKTVIRTVNTLVELGHDVTIIDTGKNRHTWTPLKAKHIIIKDKNDVPDADVIIATGFKTVISTNSLPERCGKKFHYIRGWEVWQMNEKKIINNVLNNSIIKIVNSIGLQKKLKDHGHESHIIYPGYDFDEVYFTNTRYIPNHVVIRLGGLYHTKHKTKRSDWIFEAAKILKEKGYPIKLVMFGVSKGPNINDVSFEYYRNPSCVAKNVIYNTVDLWLAPTELEGNHLVPSEAMITGCPVVGTNAPLSGMHDYLIHGKTGVVSKNNFDSFVSEIESLILQPKLMKELGKNARRKILEIGDRKHNMKKLIKLIENKMSNTLETSSKVFCHKYK